MNIAHVAGHCPTCGVTPGQHCIKVKSFNVPPYHATSTSWPTRVGAGRPQPHAAR